MARSPGGPMGGMDTGLSTIVPVDKSNNTDIASIEKQIRELTKQADRLRAQVAEEVSVKNLEECRKRLLQRGVVIGSGPCTDIDDIVKNLATGTYFFNKPMVVNFGDQFTLRLAKLVRTQFPQWAEPSRHASREWRLG
jgi:hypothetical protein